MPRRLPRLRALLLLAAAPGAARADTAAAEVAALLDFCSANPGMSYYDGTPICGGGTIVDVSLGSDVYHTHLGYEDRAQWGNGDPCAGDGWLGVTCDAAGEHVTAKCALLPGFIRLSAAADSRSCARAEICRTSRA